MKTILVPTDFSAQADNAARYAVQLAKGIKGNVKLCNVVKIPADTIMAAQVAWPLLDYDTAMDDTTASLGRLADQLRLEEEATSSVNSYHPAIEFCCQVGNVTEVVSDFVAQNKAPLVVTGMSGAGAVNRFFLGSSSRDLIHRAAFPVLLVPGSATFSGLQRIAFATDMSESDVHVVHSLASLARHFDAELLLVHVVDNDDLNEQQKIKTLMADVTNKANYPHIYYRHLHSANVDEGLAWIIENGQIDMLAMVHRQHDFIERLINGSHTFKLVRHTTLPLLVYPVNKTSYF
ncbi:universal stress protein [Mucilaginibacter sp. Bleaf8]|uniref:universal stress protein n=1 Tax=Mucilaginibacter sp. Bleaf8 TaxID=2834430 RepID=UPI001BCCD02A|nr:universal stress protein [Mucilaginibacter sp. Bleaf8]MBS7565208.1 universal stress protein [Mucilaginibacter sp. Bleaf8]